MFGENVIASFTSILFTSLSQISQSRTKNNVELAFFFLVAVFLVVL